MAKKSLKIKKKFSLSPKKINRQNKATAYKAQWIALLGLRNPINPLYISFPFPLMCTLQLEINSSINFFVGSSKFSHFFGRFQFGKS
jgi:hypothetical protein